MQYLLTLYIFLSEFILTESCCRGSKPDPTFGNVDYLTIDVLNIL